MERDTKNKKLILASNEVASRRRRHHRCQTSVQFWSPVRKWLTLGFFGEVGNPYPTREFLRRLLIHIFFYEKKKENVWEIGIKYSIQPSFKLWVVTHQSK